MGPYKSALIVALHCQLRSAAIDAAAIDKAAIDNAAIIKKSIATPHDVLMAAAIEKDRSRRAALENSTQLCSSTAAAALRRPHQLPHQSEFCRNRSAFIRPDKKCRNLESIYFCLWMRRAQSFRIKYRQKINWII